jgi:hypothetical protein
MHLKTKYKCPLISPAYTLKSSKYNIHASLHREINSRTYVVILFSEYFERENSKTLSLSSNSHDNLLIDTNTQAHSHISMWWNVGQYEMLHKHILIWFILKDDHIYVVNNKLKCILYTFFLIFWFWWQISKDNIC